MVYYKIIKKTERGIETLYHGLDGSKLLEENKWYRARKILARDGGKQKPYLTGIHLFKNRDTAEKYIRKFKDQDDKIIVPCSAAGLRVKPTNKEVFLADRFKIIGKVI